MDIPVKIILESDRVIFEIRLTQQDLVDVENISHDIPLQRFAEILDPILEKEIHIEDILEETLVDASEEK